MAAADPGLDMGPSGSRRETDYHSDELWAQHDAHWREHFATRPYARADHAYEHHQPAYRYGHGSAVRHRGREWTEVERISSTVGIRRAGARRRRGATPTRRTGAGLVAASR